MKSITGTPLSSGLASGTAIVIGYELQRRIAPPVIDGQSIVVADVSSECDRMDHALKKSKYDLDRFVTAAGDQASLATAVELSAAHLAMASEIAASVKEHIAKNLVGVEQSLDFVIRFWIRRFQQIENEYLRERETDIRDVGQQMMRHLIGGASLDSIDLPAGSIVVARELVPSDTIALANSGVVAIVSQFGGKLGHTAIIARSLGIPAISCIPNLTQRIASGDKLLVDGTTGIVIVSPNVEQNKQFLNRVAATQRASSNSCPVESDRCRTRDGTEILILGNVGLRHEIDQVLRQGLGGVGLFRTEFFYMKAHVRPNSASQQEIYSEMANQLGEKPLVIRTVDLGEDKIPPFLALDSNIDQSGLSLRGLRFSLRERDLLNEQLRAIVNAAQTADIRVLFPMVIGGHDLETAIAAVDQAVKDCDGFRRPLIGAMIETPAALFCLDEILQLCDFIAIGTNDLTQYLLSADRDLAAGNDDCTALHPAVLRAIRQVVEAAQRWNRPVCVCGEEAGEPQLAKLLIGLGIRELSVSPQRANEIRDAIGKIDIVQSEQLAKQSLACRCPAEVRELLSSSERSAFVVTANRPPLHLLGTNA